MPARRYRTRGPNFLVSKLGRHRHVAFQRRPAWSAIWIGDLSFRPPGDAFNRDAVADA